MTIDKEFESFLFSQDDGEMYSSAYRRAWQAARAIDAKRIVELEAWANRPVTDNTQLIANMEAQITDLEAQNKAMREVLQAYSENKKIGLAATCVLAALDKEGE